MDCIFCKIIQGEIPAEILYQDEHLAAFRDIRPQAPSHLLIIPKDHIKTINDLTPQHQELIGKMVICAQKLAKDENFAESGYRLVFNCNEDGGQEVYHIHLHLLGGRRMHWPPG